MPERWEQKLRSLRRLEMPTDRVWARIEQGPHPEPPPRMSTRLLVALVAFSVFAAGGSLAWLALRPTTRPTTSAGGTEPPAWLVDQAYQMAYQSGDITPTSGEWVLSDADTIAPAVGLEHGDPALQEYLVVLHGDFTAYSAKVPPGADLPTGHVLSFATSADTHEISDWGVGDGDVNVPGLEPFTLPTQSQLYTDVDGGWTVSVPPGWKSTAFTLGMSGLAPAGSMIANAEMPLPVAPDRSLPQISAEGFPDDGVALVIAPSAVMPDSRVWTPPLSIDDFNQGSAPAGGSTLDTMWFTSKGTGAVGPPLVFGMTLRIGPQASRVDLDAIDDVISSLTFSPTATSVPTGLSGPTATVTLQILVPDVVGLGEDAALVALKEAGLFFSIEHTQSNDVAEGVVISQDPAAGMYMDPRTPVTIAVSSGPPSGSAVFRCPDASDADAVTAADADAAVATTEQFLWGPDAKAALDPVGTENGLEPGSGTGKETVLDTVIGGRFVAPACGTEVADATYAVTFDDGTDSASLDFTLYVIHRSDGWKVWGLY
jgi:hypothetical protein